MFLSSSALPGRWIIKPRSNALKLKFGPSSWRITFEGQDIHTPVVLIGENGQKWETTIGQLLTDILRGKFSATKA